MHPLLSTKSIISVATWAVTAKANKVAGVRFSVFTHTNALPTANMPQF